MIIDRGCQDEHVRIQKKRVDILHIILLNTFSGGFGMAMFASQAAIDFFTADIHDGYLMPGCEGTLPEGFNHLLRIAFGTRTSVQYQNMHDDLLIFWPGVSELRQVRPKTPAHRAFGLSV